MSPAQGFEDCPGVPPIEEIDGECVPALHQRCVEVPQEPGRSQPEIVPDEEEALDTIPVALAKSADELSSSAGPPGVEPLLELIQDDQEFPARCQEGSPPDRR